VKKRLTEKEKTKIVAEYQAGDVTVNQLCEKYGRGFYTIKALVEDAEPDNDNATKIALVNKALVKAEKAEKKDPTTALFKRFYAEIRIAAPNARRVVLDLERGECVLSVLNQLVVKVS
jgi:transposase-like protein